MRATLSFAPTQWIRPPSFLRRSQIRFCPRTLCMLASTSSNIPTTVIDLSAAPFRDGGTRLIRALISLGKECVDKRRVILVADPSNKENKIGEEAAVCGWRLETEGSLADACSAALDSELELRSVPTAALYCLTENKGSFKKEVLALDELNSVLTGLEPHKIPDVLALSELKGFGLKRATAKLSGYDSLEELHDKLCSGKNARVSKLDRSIMENAHELFLRSEALRINTDKKSKVDLGEIVQAEVLHRTLRLQSQIAGLPESRMGDTFQELRSIPRTDSLPQKSAEDRESNSVTDIFLVDVMNLVYRAYYASTKTNLSGASSGVPYGTLYIFARRIVRLIFDYAHDRHPIVFVFEGRHLVPGVDFRSDIFPEYKSGRDEVPEEIIRAMEYVESLAASLGLTQMQAPGHEADDAIATLVSKARSLGIKSWIVSLDHDFRQLLVQDEVTILKPVIGFGATSSSSWKVDTEEAFGEEYGGLSPRQYVDMRALIGDKSDALPGLRGFGPKTVVKLMTQYGSLEKILQNAHRVERKVLSETLQEGKELARSMKEVIHLVQDIEYIDDKRFKLAARRNPVSTTILRNWCDQLNMSPKPMMKLIEDGHLHVGPAGQEIENQHPLPETTLLEPDEFMQQLSKESEISAYCTDEVFAFCLDDGRGACVQVGDSEQVRAQLKPLTALMNQEGFRIAGWNLKPLLKIATEDQQELLKCKLFDLEIASFLIDGGAPLSASQQISSLTNRDVGDIFSSDAQSDLLQIAASAPRTVAAATEVLHKEGLNDLAEIEFALVPVLAQMEVSGVRIDLTQLKEIESVLMEEKSRIEEQIFALDGVPSFNLASSQQLGRVLQEMGVKLKKKRTGNLSTSEAVLTQLLSADSSSDTIKQLISLLLRHRSLSKLLSTYLVGLAKLVEEDGRIHAQFNQTAAITGRLSVSKPNLQAIPVRDELGREIRKSIVPREGFVLVSADYEQIELRILAALSADQEMLSAFARGDDIHSLAAMRLYKLGSLSEVTKTQRNNAKAVNYGIPYGISAPGLAVRMQTTMEEAQKIIDEYFAAFPQIKEYLEDLVDKARDKGYAETLQGRRRSAPGIISGNRTERLAAERFAVNMPIQGTQADLIKIAMTRIAQLIQEEGLQSRMILQVHDELLFETSPSELDRVLEIVETNMKNAIEFPNGMELKVSVGIGSSWYDTK